VQDFLFYIQWSIAVSAVPRKTVDVKASGGSNPSLSARLQNHVDPNDSWDFSFLEDSESSRMLG